MMEHGSEGHQGGKNTGISGGYSSGGSQGGYMVGVAGEQYNGSCVCMEWEKGKRDAGCIL